MRCSGLTIADERLWEGNRERDIESNGNRWRHRNVLIMMTMPLLQYRFVS